MALSRAADGFAGLTQFLEQLRRGDSAVAHTRDAFDGAFTWLDSLRSRHNEQIFATDYDGITFDGSTDDSAGWQTLMDAVPAAGADIFLKPGATSIFNSEVTCPSNVNIIGHMSTLKAGADFDGAMLSWSSKTNVSIEGVTFDQNRTGLGDNTHDTAHGAGNDIQTSGAISWVSSSHLTLRRCYFKDTRSVAVWLNIGSGKFLVDDCRFDHTQFTTSGWGFQIYAVTYGGHFTIRDSFFDGPTQTDTAKSLGAIFIFGMSGLVTVKDNWIDHYGRDHTAVGGHRSGSIDLYGLNADVRIEGNQVHNAMWLGIRVNGFDNAIIEGNYVDQKYSPQVDSFGSINLARAVNTYSGTKAIVKDNIIDVASGLTNVTGIQLQTSDWGLPFDNVRVTGNIINGAEIPIKASGPITNLTVDHNHAYGTNTSHGFYWVIDGSQTAVEGTEANSVVDRIQIHDNIWESDGDCVFIDANGYAGTMGDIRHHGDYCEDIKASGANVRAVFYRNVGQVHITGLTIRGFDSSNEFTNGIQVSTAARTFLGDCWMYDTGTALSLTAANDLQHHIYLDGTLVAGGDAV